MENLKKIKSVETFIKRAPRSGPRVLVADIETFPVIAYTWGLFKANIGVDQIVDDFKLMSFAGKWLNDPAYFYVDNRTADEPRDDTRSVAASWRVLENTDVVIAHNGARFDLPKLRARFALKGLEPLPVIPVIDTLLQNRKAFAFDSHRLAYVSDRFGDVVKDEHKNYPGFKLWKGCMDGELAAWQENESYNVTDILSLESMYLALRGWYQGAANIGNYFDEHVAGEHRCPNCGSTHVHQRGTRRTQVGVYARYHCNDCGGWSRGRLQIIAPSERQHVLIN